MLVQELSRKSHFERDMFGLCEAEFEKQILLARELDEALAEVENVSEEDLDSLEHRLKQRIVCWEQFATKIKTNVMKMWFAQLQTVVNTTDLPTCNRFIDLIDLRRMPVSLKDMFNCLRELAIFMTELRDSKIECRCFWRYWID